MAVKKFKLEYLPKKVLVATVEIPIGLIENPLFYKDLVEKVLDIPSLKDWNCASLNIINITVKDSNGTQYIIEEKNTLSKRILEFYKVDGVSNNLKLCQI